MAARSGLDCRAQGDDDLVEDLKFSSFFFHGSGLISFSLHIQVAARAIGLPAVPEMMVVMNSCRLKNW